MIQFDGGEYSVPDDDVSQEVWVRQQDDEIVIVHVGRDGPHEIARWNRPCPDNHTVTTRTSDPQRKVHCRAGRKPEQRTKQRSWRSDPVPRSG